LSPYCHTILLVLGSIRTTRLFQSSVAAIIPSGSVSAIGAQISLRLAGAHAAVAVHYGSNREAAERMVATIAAGGGRAVALAADLVAPEPPPSSPTLSRSDSGRSTCSWRTPASADRVPARPSMRPRSTRRWR
jgi:hypothetical protein